MVLKEPLPYVCSVCDEIFKSKAEKATPRHHCTGDFEGKAGVGIPADDHPEYTPPPEPTEGDIELDTPELDTEEQLAGIPTVSLEDLESTPDFDEPSEPPPRDEPVITSTTKASAERLMVLNRAMVAIMAGDNLDMQTAMLILTELWSGTIDVEVQEAVKVEVGGTTYILTIAAISVALLAKVYWQQQKLKAMQKQAKQPKENERW